MADITIFELNVEEAHATSYMPFSGRGPDSDSEETTDQPETETNATDDSDGSCQKKRIAGIGFVLLGLVALAILKNRSADTSEAK